MQHTSTEGTIWQEEQRVPTRVATPKQKDFPWIQLLSSVEHNQTLNLNESFSKTVLQRLMECHITNCNQRSVMRRHKKGRGATIISKEYVALSEIFVQFKVRFNLK